MTSFSFTGAEKELFFSLKRIFRQRGCFLSSDYLDQEALDYAEFYAGQGSIEGLMWCSEIEDHVFFSNTLDYAIPRDHREVIKWLREHGCPWGEDNKVLARYYDYDDLEEWLKQQGCPSPRIKIGPKPTTH